MIEINKNPSARELKQFGALWLIFFAIVGGITWYRTGSQAGGGCCLDNRAGYCNRGIFVAIVHATGLRGDELCGLPHRVVDISHCAGTCILSGTDSDCFRP